MKQCFSITSGSGSMMSDSCVIYSGGCLAVSTSSWQQRGRMRLRAGRSSEPAAAPCEQSEQLRRQQQLKEREIELQEVQSEVLPAPHPLDW